LPTFKPKKLWNIHATMHGISALSVIRFIDIKLVKCDLSPLKVDAGHGMAWASMIQGHPGSTNQQTNLPCGWAPTGCTAGSVPLHSQTCWQDLHDDNKTCMQLSYWELILENGQ
jgi:hypothetical protein